MKRKRTKQEKKDLWMVLAILASVFLIAFICSWLTSRNITVGEYTGSVAYRRAQAREITRNIMISAGIISFVIIGIYIFISARGRKKRIRQEQREEVLLQKERVNQAKRRIAMAKIDAELEKQRGLKTGYKMESSGREHLYDYDNYCFDDDELSQEEYLEKLMEEREQRQEQKRRKKKIIVSGIAAILLVLGIILWIII